MSRFLALIPVIAAACSSSSQAYQTSPPPMAMQQAQLTSIALATNEGAPICPNAMPPVQLVVTGVASDGRQLATPTNYRMGTPYFEEHGLPWPRFRISASSGAVNGAAMYVPPAN